MFRKLITGILILTLLGQVGCYTSTQITLDEWIESKEKGDISLTTNDELIYKFDKYYYVIKSDTLCGEGIEYNNEGEKQNFEGCIPTAKIHSVEMKEINTGMTVLSVVIILGVIVAAVLINSELPDIGN